MKGRELVLALPSFYSSKLPASACFSQIIVREPPWKNLETLAGANVQWEQGQLRGAHVCPGHLKQLWGVAFERVG